MSFLNLNINVSQKIAQTITTDTIQHLEILQYSNIELADFISEKAAENPLLTVVEDNTNHVKGLVDFAKTSYYTTRNNKKDSVMQFQSVQNDATHQFLLEQIPAHQNSSSLDKKILEYLIYHVDERLFLTIDLEEVALKFNVTENDVESILHVLQRFEPVGVASRNFKEYLLIQIANDENAPEYAYQFVQNHLEDIANLAMKQLCRIYTISIEETKKTFDYIKQLKPYPPTIVTIPTELEYLIPDVELIKFEGEWIIEMNNGFFPKVTINEVYVNLLKSDMQYKAYYQQCMKDAMLLIQGIEERQKTLYRIVRLLLDMQSELFEMGLSALKPMRLIDVAEILNIHESTVSRAIRNKYIRTPIGIFSIKSLFSKGISNNSGTINSVIHIKSRIKHLIEEEDRLKPLSDQNLTILLKKEGIQISRRTVAKYREEMNIKNSAKRMYL